MVDEFEQQYRLGYRQTLIDIWYYRPDYPSLVQEFSWQTLDVPPQFPRMAKFLDHWRRNIDAVIKEIFLSSMDRLGKSEFHNVDRIYYC